MPETKGAVSEAEEWTDLLSVEKLCPVFTPKPQVAQSSTGSLKCNWLQASTLCLAWTYALYMCVCVRVVCPNHYIVVCAFQNVYLRCSMCFNFLPLEEPQQERDSSCPSDLIPKIKGKKTVGWLNSVFLDKVRFSWINAGMITLKFVH